MADWHQQGMSWQSYLRGCCCRLVNESEIGSSWFNCPFCKLFIQVVVICTIICVQGTDTVHYGAIHSFQKFFFNKGIVCAQFWPKFEKSTFGWSKTLKRFRKKYSHQIFVKKMWYLLAKKHVPDVS